MSVVLLPAAAALWVWLGSADAGAAVLGVLGWLIALAARLPVVGTAGRLRDVRRGRRLLAVTSGVTDEIARLMLVLIGGTAFAPVLWAGFGWAVADLVFADGVAGAKTVRGVVRGTTVIAFHLGATVLLAADPWWALLTAPVHVAVNLALTRRAQARPTS